MQIENLARYGDRCAYRFGGQELSFAALSARSGALAAWLAKRGEPHVGICGADGPETLAAMTACLRCGVAYLPLDPAQPPARLAAMAALAGLQTVLLTDGCAAAIDGIPCIPADSIRTAGGESRFSPRDTDGAYLLFTSGSTGAPKGVAVRRGNLAHFARWLWEIPAIAETQPQSVFCAARFSFDLSVAPLVCMLTQGCSYTALPPERLSDPAALFRTMADSKAELLVATPTFAELCLCDRCFDAALLPRLRVLFFCGEPLKPATAAKLFSRFPGVRILNAYGPTEATCAVCASEITPADTACALLPAGDCAGAAAALSLSARGTVVLHGKSVAAYLGGGGGGFLPDGGYDTGDVGSFCGGKLYLHGRLDRMIKYKGYRIEPAEVENALCRIPGVTSAAVSPCALPDGRVTALRATVAASGVGEAELRDALRALLPDYMIPKQIELTDRPALTVNGKQGLR